MAFEIEFVPESEEDLEGIRPFYRNQILDAIELHLGHTPTQISRSRIKRLRSVESPAYRLRVGEFRVFYDVDEEQRVVMVLRVLSKEQSLQYLREANDEDRGVGKHEQDDPQPGSESR
jgi:mRNA-degrading endonuclease RelE of RelBE toxin-antitoxin system